MPETLYPLIVKALERLKMPTERFFPLFKPDIKVTILSCTNQMISFKVEYSPAILPFLKYDPPGKLLQIDFSVTGSSSDFKTIKGTIPAWSTFHTVVTITKLLHYDPKPVGTEWAIVVTVAVDPGKEIAERNEINNRDIAIIGFLE